MAANRQVAAATLPSPLAGAPACKALMLSMATGSVWGLAWGKVPSTLNVHRSFVSQLTRLPQHAFGLHVPYHLFLGLAGMYTMRTLERRLGTRRFFAAAVTMFTLSTVLQWHLCLYLGRDTLVSGLGVLFGMAVLLALDVPSVKDVRFLGVRLPDTFYTYVLLLQLAIASPPDSYIAVASAMVSGLLTRIVLSWLAVPTPLARLADAVFGPFLRSPPRALEFDPVRGARTRTTSGTGAQYNDRLVGGPGAGPWGFGAGAAAREPSAANVNTLVSMGFPRSRVIEALQATGDNVDAATEMLLR